MIDNDIVISFDQNFTPELLKHFAAKLKANNLTDLQSFTNQLANIDLDIYLSFDPERCLFREQNLKFEETKKKEFEEDFEKLNFDEEAMLGKVLLKEEDKDMLKQKEDQYLREVRSKKKRQKDMTTDEISLLFMMQGVLIDTFIKAVKVEVVSKSAFVGTMVRLVENINRHLIAEGGFFSLLVNLRSGKHVVFYFDEQDSVFRANYYESPLLDLIEDDSNASNTQYVIKDMMDVGSLIEAKAALEFHDTLLKVASNHTNSTFKNSSPDKSVWLTHFLKLKNSNYRQKKEKSQIKSVTFLSAHHVYSIPEIKKSKRKKQLDIDSLATNSINKHSKTTDQFAEKSHNLEMDSILKELKNLKPDLRHNDAVFKQIAIFLNYFTNFTDFMQIINERSTIESFSSQLFSKFEEALVSIESSKN